MFFKHVPNFFYSFFIDFLFKYYLFLFITHLTSIYSICRPYRSFFKLKHLLALSKPSFSFFKSFFFYSFNLNLKFQNKLRNNNFFLIRRFWTTGVYHVADLEFFWTIIPMLYVFFMLIPSLILLYSMQDSSINFWGIFPYKVIGNQWYWIYEYIYMYSNCNNNIITDLNSFLVNNDNFLIDDNSIYLNTNKPFRLLETDYKLILTQNKKIQFFITSDDVIHSWSVPSLGLKLDALPGRLNYIIFTPLKEGVFYGMCSEICGVNHAFMPISLLVIQ